MRIHLRRIKTCIVHFRFYPGVRDKGRLEDSGDKGGESPWKEMARSAEFLGHRLMLTKTEKEIHGGFSTNLRRNIARSKKEDLKVDITTSSEAMEEYYRLHCITRKGHGIPPQPRKFFGKIQEHLLRQNLGFITLARYRGVAVAGAIFLHYGIKRFTSSALPTRLGNRYVRTTS